jgi:hypothetical protein
MVLSKKDEGKEKKRKQEMEMPCLRCHWKKFFK